MIKNQDLVDISLEIRDILEAKRKELSLTFIEDTHTYFMKDLKGKIVSSYPSVSAVLKKFYTEFPAKSKSLDMAQGDIVEQQRLLTEWAGTATYANNIGSRCHFLLEKEVIVRNGNYKEVRQPIFNCDDVQLEISNIKIEAGKRFLDLMEERGCVLLDTEIIMGSPKLGYVGQPDLVYLVRGKTGEIGLLICDHKTNKKKNFEIQPWTISMKEPFQDLDDTALSHYYLQLPLYGKLLIDMLKGTKYEGLKIMGGIIVHLLDEGVYNEIKIPKKIMDRVLELDVKKYIKS